MALPSSSPPENLPERPEHWREWSLDLCQNVVFTEDLRPVEHSPDSSDLFFARGFAELVSVAPVRAMERELPGQESVCRYHYGKMDVSADGFASPVFCTQPHEGDMENFRSIGRPWLFLQGKKDPNERLDEGFAGWIGAYEAPRWTDLLFHSHGAVCRGIV
jgi:hypothetical protein